MDLEESVDDFEERSSFRFKSADGKGELGFFWRDKLFGAVKERKFEIELFMERMQTLL